MDAKDRRGKIGRWAFLKGGNQEKQTEIRQHGKSGRSRGLKNGRRTVCSPSNPSLSPFTCVQAVILNSQIERSLMSKSFVGMRKAGMLFSEVENSVIILLNNIDII